MLNRGITFLSILLFLKRINKNKNIKAMVLVEREEENTIKFKDCVQYLIILIIILMIMSIYDILKKKVKKILEKHKEMTSNK